MYASSHSHSHSRPFHRAVSSNMWQWFPATKFGAKPLSIDASAPTNAIARPTRKCSYLHMRFQTQRSIISPYPRPDLNQWVITTVAVVEWGDSLVLNAVCGVSRPQGWGWRMRSAVFWLMSNLVEEIWKQLSVWRMNLGLYTEQNKRYEHINALVIDH